MRRVRHNWQETNHRRARRFGVKTESINRRAIIKRDDYTCYLCGRRLGCREITIDHVVPLSRGGHHSEDNLRVACFQCNRRKGIRLLSECVWLKTGELTIKKR